MSQVEDLAAPLDLAQRLEPFVERLAVWQADARLLRGIAVQAEARGDVTEASLLQVEEISSAIQADIAQITGLETSLETTSPTDMVLIIEVADALRLVLLEITETGTQLYSTRSRPLDP